MGTGYHGGFGATRGSAYKKSSSDSSIPAITRVIRKQDKGLSTNLVSKRFTKPGRAVFSVVFRIVNLVE